MKIHVSTDCMFSSIVIGWGVENVATVQLVCRLLETGRLILLAVL